MVKGAGANLLLLIVIPFLFIVELTSHDVAPWLGVEPNLRPSGLLYYSPRQTTEKRSTCPQQHRKHPEQHRKQTELLRKQRKQHP